MKKFNIKERRYFSMFLAIWSIFLIISGIFMNTQVESVVQTNYKLNTDVRRIAEAQAKSNEIKLKEIELEVNTPLSINVRDYLLDIDNLNSDTIRSLKLDTSLVNIHQAGEYSFKILYGKKTYEGKVTVKEKELPNVTFSLKTISIHTNDSLSTDVKTYIQETVTEEVYQGMTLDLSKVDPSVQGDYTYYISYKEVIYQGKVEVRDICPTIAATIIEEKQEEVSTITCPSDAEISDNTCVCIDKEKTFDSETKTCK